ncbi:hypothetical protein H0H93_013356 [Arthromyces matolae]|nr:hypothetical protein H0H93_013356 [Arthromyces matolae]
MATTSIVEVAHRMDTPLITRHNKNPVRMLVFLKRKPGITHEEFGSFWRTKHAKAFLALDIVKKNVINYEQIHIKQHPKIPGVLGLPLQGWDGIVLLDGESYEKLFEVFEDKQFNATVLPENALFVDTSNIRTLLTHVDPFIEDHLELKH